MLYLGAADPTFNTRTWQDAIGAYQEREGKEETISRSGRALARIILPAKVSVTCSDDACANPR
jgi:hypothetical protein